ncbi:MAG TPA: lysine 2,3-aminomutase [Deltaproteobacteria bacterium]|nr:lysine 2,3-aminomutase [Deltaproteobacteria bacterium]
MRLPYLDNSKPLYYQRCTPWREVPRSDWDNWKWQLQHTITTAEQVAEVLPLAEADQESLRHTFAKYKFAVAPYYLSLADPHNPECPIRLQCIPSLQELHVAPEEMNDPLAEDADMPVPNVVHRYPDRVLVTITGVCSMYCRFCTRRRFVLDKEGHKQKNEIDIICDYIGSHPEIRDVIVSGGDALMMGVPMLKEILGRIRAIPHVEILRLASKIPCVLPMRITDDLVDMLKAFKPLYFMTHFNHPYEISPEAKIACDRLVDGGIPIFNQTVLLRKINSDAVIMKKLMQELLALRVKPYYIYQCDLSEGISHFRTPVEKGIELIESLRGHTSGLAVPEFVIDVPGGGGKIPVAPHYLISQSDKKVVVRNYEGYIGAYPQPTLTDCTCSTAASVGAAGLVRIEHGPARLLHEEAIAIEPRETQKTEACSSVDEAPVAVGPTR